MSKREIIKQIESISEEINNLWGEIDLAEWHYNECHEYDYLQDLHLLPPP